MTEPTQPVKDRKKMTLSLLYLVAAIGGAAGWGFLRWVMPVSEHPELVRSILGEPSTWPDWYSDFWPLELMLFMVSCVVLVYWFIAAMQTSPHTSYGLALRAVTAGVLAATSVCWGTTFLFGWLTGLQIYLAALMGLVALAAFVLFSYIGYRLAHQYIAIRRARNQPFQDDPTQG